MHGFKIMNNVNGYAILRVLFKFVLLVVFAQNTQAKTAQLDNTLYCNQEIQVSAMTQLMSLPHGYSIDRIVVSKKQRKLFLLTHGYLYKSYDVTFGFGFLKGVKQFESDGATPEGLYYVELKKNKSNYHRALKVSYPNDLDISHAAAQGRSAGSDIMIHGFPNPGLEGFEKFNSQLMHPQVNWTQGCIAMTNKEINEVYSLVKEQTPIEICPL